MFGLKRMRKANLFQKEVGLGRSDGAAQPQVCVRAIYIYLSTILTLFQQPPEAWSHPQVDRRGRPGPSKT